EQIEDGRASAGRTDPHRIVVFVKGRVDADRGEARRAIAGMLLDDGGGAQLGPLDREQELDDLKAIADVEAIARELPDGLVDVLAAAGAPEQVVASLLALAEAGADAIAFVPVGPDRDDQLRLLAEFVAPVFRGSQRS